MKNEELINKHILGFRKRQAEYPDLFDLEFWKKQESYKLIKNYIPCKDFSIFEVGCLTGHHLLLLEQEGYKYLTGCDFVKEAIDWGKERTENINFINNSFEDIVFEETIDYLIVFDVLEHVSDIPTFLTKIKENMHKRGEVLFLVPKDHNFPDECHINHWKNKTVFGEMLEEFFEIDDLFYVENNMKIFARGYWK